MISRLTFLAYNALCVTHNVNKMLWQQNKVYFSDEWVLPVQLTPLKKYKYFIKFLSLLSFLWSKYFYWTLYLIFFFQAAWEIVKFLTAKKAKLQPLSETLFLNASARAFPTYHASRRNENFTILNISEKYPVDEKFKDYPKITIYDLIVLKDIFAILPVLRQLILLINKFHKNKIICLQAFSLLLTQRALMKYPGLKKIIFCNMDRWSYVCTAIPGVDCIFMQHGLLAANLSPKYFGHSPWKKISVGYFYSKSQVNTALKFIKTIDHVEYFSPQLRLGSIPHPPDIKTVLLIGCVALFQEKELEIIKSYSSCSNISLYVKPHPVHPVSFYLKLKKEFDFILIDQKDFFPDVDEVISYESTLAYEYELCGKKIIIYSMFS